MHTNNKFYGICSRGFNEALLYSVNSIMLPLKEVGPDIYKELLWEKIFEFYTLNHSI